jgi:hypothetical protein
MSTYAVSKSTACLKTAMALSFSSGTVSSWSAQYASVLPLLAQVPGCGQQSKLFHGLLM